MADYDSLQLIWGPMAGHTVNGFSTSDLSLNDADNAQALVFCAPKDGTIDRVGLYVRTITGNPPPYNLGITEVTTSGVPNQVAAGGSAIESYDFVATGWHWITLTTPAVVSAGAILAAHIFPGASAPDAANYINVQKSMLSWKVGSLPRMCNYTIAWAAMESPFAMAAQYSDGETVSPGYDTNTFTVSMDTGTTPDEVGCRFQVPFDCKCIGAVFPVRFAGGAGSDFTTKLYSDAGALLSSVDIDVSQALAAGYSNHALIVYWDEQTLTANTWYRLTILPTTLNNVDITQLECNEDDSRKWFCEGERWYKCERTDGGAFTDDTTAIVMMGLVLSQITIGDGAAAGGGSYGMIIG